MPNKDKTELVLILDRSGSMHDRITDVLGGVNQLLADQARLPGEAVATIVVFDHEYAQLHEACSVAGLVLTPLQYSARGNTALLDAIGRTINAVGARLARTPEEQRPGKVLVSIFTDGLENASTEFKPEQVKAMIEHQRGKYGWDFTFVGANQDAVLTAQKFGIDVGKAITFNSSRAGVGNVMRAMSAYAGQARLSSDVSAVNYSAADRALAVEEDKTPVPGGER